MSTSKSFPLGQLSAPHASVRGVCLTLGILILAAVLLLPVFGVIFGSFSSGASTWEHVKANLLGAYAVNTVMVMLWVGLLTATIGTGAAWLVTSIEFPGRRILEWALVLPIASPAYIIAYVYTDLLDFAGPVQTALRAITGWSIGDYWFPPIRTLEGAGIVLSFVLFPYVYLLARSAFLNQSHTRFAAARSLGASPLRAFWAVALPAARPAIIGGVMLTLMETAADFGVSDYFGVSTFSTGIFRTWYGMGDHVSALRLAGMLLILMGLLVVGERAFRPQNTGSDIARDQIINRMKPRLSLQLLCTIACAVPVLIGFAIPVTALTFMAMGEGLRTGLLEFLNYAANSVMLSGAASGITLALALGLAYAQRGRTRNERRRLTGSATRLATLGYALPGTLLGVGLLMPLTAIDKSFSRWMLASFDINLGLVMTGSVFTLLYACVIRFLTVSYNTIEPAVSAIPRAMDEAARTLGSRLSRIVFEVHLPGLRPAIYSAMLLVFIDTMRELPATLLLRPINFETLATRVYRLASDERLAEASVSALALVLIGLIPVILINRLAQKS